jgi:hypothetical protein
VVLSQTTHFARPLAISRRLESVTAYSAPQWGQKKELPGVISPINGMAAPRSFKAIVRLAKSSFQNRTPPQLAHVLRASSADRGVFIPRPRRAAAWSFSGTDRRLTPKLFSFAQEPIEIDGLVKILSGLKPNRIYEPRGREVCP